MGASQFLRTRNGSSDPGGIPDNSPTFQRWAIHMTDFCIQTGRSDGYIGSKSKHSCVESAENQTMRFTKPRDPEEAEVREDARLLSAIAEGDQQALAAVYRRHGGLIYSLLLRMLVNEMEAQEVMQDTFLQFWRRAPECEPQRSSPLSWMIMIARGRTLDRLRARSRRSATHAAYEREVASLEVELSGSRQAERD